MKMCKYKKNSNSIKENILPAWNGAQILFEKYI